MGGAHSLPPVGDAEYLVMFACEAGIYQLTWSELNAWKLATCASISPWETAAIKLIADAYTNTRDASNNNDAAPAPWQEAKLDRKKIDQDVRNALRGRQRT